MIIFQLTEWLNYQNSDSNRKKYNNQNSDSERQWDAQKNLKRDIQQSDSDSDRQQVAYT